MNYKTLQLTLLLISANAFGMFGLGRSVQRVFQARPAIFVKNITQFSKRYIKKVPKNFFTLKKTNTSLLVASTLLLGTSCYAMPQPINVEDKLYKWETSLTTEQLKKYKLPDHLKDKLDQHANDICNWCYEDKWNKDIPWLPGYIIKQTNWSGRLKGYDLCTAIIKENPERFNLLDVPKKYHYYNPVDGNNYVIVEKIDGAICRFADYAWGDLQFTLQQCQQLCDFIMETGWNDSKRNDLVIHKNGKVYILDTEVDQFYPNTWSPRSVSGCTGISLLGRREDFFDRKALKYFQQFQKDHCRRA